MNLDKANYIIAKYLGWIQVDAPDYGPDTYYWKNHKNELGVKPCFSSSLDEQLPAWEKLGVMPTFRKGRGTYVTHFQYKHISKDKKAERIYISSNGKVGFYRKFNNIQESACIATAKLIERLL